MILQLISGERSRTTSPSATILSGVISTAYGGTKFTPRLGAMCRPSGAYSPFGFSSGSSVLPSSDPCVSTTRRSAESSTFLNGPWIWLRSLTTMT